MRMLSGSCLDVLRVHGHVRPPEDAGGIGGYAGLLEDLDNPKHPEYQHLRQWAGAAYDPELFSVQQANSALANLD